MLAKPDVKLPKPTAQRIDLVAPQFKYIAAGGGVVQSIIDAVLNQTPYPVKGWIMSRHNPFKPLHVDRIWSKPLNSSTLWSVVMSI